MNECVLIILCQRFDKIVFDVSYELNSIQSLLNYKIHVAEDADYNPFNSIRRNKTHVLRHYFVEKKLNTRLLHVRAHNFVLPPRYNRNFVSMMMMMMMMKRPLSMCKPTYPFATFVGNCLQ